MKYPSPLAWFEIVTQDFERAILFYETAFNIKLNRSENDHMKYAIFPYNENNVGGALVYSEHYNDHLAGPNTIMIYLNTDSVSAQLSIIQNIGGEVVLPLTPIGENGYIAGFKDSEGNYVGLWSMNA